MHPFIVLIQHPLVLTAFLLFILSELSLWINRKIWIWGPLFILFYIIAYLAHVVELVSLVPIIFFMLSLLSLRLEKSPFWILFSTMIAIMLSFGFLSHLLKGINNFVLLDNVFLPNSSSTHLTLYFDNGIVGLFILGLFHPLINSKAEWKKTLIYSTLWILLTAILLFGGGIVLKILTFRLHFSSFFFFWMISEFFLVVIPQEAFFRGLIQRQIQNNLNNSASSLLAILVSSLLFSLLHLYVNPHLWILLPTFTASLFFGGIYILTGTIESAILVHFMINVLQFLFFSYSAS